jgi:hypothetical protein
MPATEGSFTLDLESGSDDGREDDEGFIYLTETQIGGGLTAMIGLLFRNLNFPSTATITTAYLSVTPTHSSYDSPNLTIRAEFDPANFSTANNDFSSRTLTATGATWSVADIGINEAKSSPSIAAVLQEVIDTPGWSSGDNVAFFLTGTGLMIAGYEHATYAAAQLVGEWALAPPASEGAGDLTQAGNTLSAAGVLPLTGAAALTQEAQTVAAASALSTHGALAQTQVGDAVSATATATTHGAANLTQADNALTPTGVLATHGAASIAAAGDTSTAAAVLPIVGAAALTAAGDTVAATVAIGIHGAAALTQADNTVAAVGGAASGSSASLTQDDNTLTAAAVLATHGAATLTQDGDALTATGTLPAYGAASLTQDDNTATATALLVTHGAAAI